MKDQQAFEAWCRERWGDNCVWLKPADGYCYGSNFANDLWSAWLAGQDAMVKDLAEDPEPMKFRITMVDGRAQMACLNFVKWDD